MTQAIPCPCGGSARLVDARECYPHRPDLYGQPRYLCDCGAHVGCHPGTTEPLGTPADAETRRARAAAHAAFDPLWRRAGLPGARRRAYAWLARRLGLSVDECHIGLMDVQQCERVVALCQAALRKDNARRRRARR